MRNFIIVFMAISLLNSCTKSDECRSNVSYHGIYPSELIKKIG